MNTKQKQVVCEKCGKVMYPNWVTRHVCGEPEKYVKKYTPKSKLVMICPNGWKNCDLCEYISPNNTCLLPKSDIDIVVLAAKIAEEVVTKEAIESVEKIRGTWMEEFDQLPEGGIWEWMARYRTPHINYKETLNGGPSEPGGGSKSRVPKKSVKKMPEYMKILGM
jgi:hypothetical protein